MDKDDFVLNFKKPKKKSKKKKKPVENNKMPIKQTVNVVEKQEEFEKKKGEIKKAEEKSNLILTMDLFGIDDFDINDEITKPDINKLQNIDSTDEYDDFI